MKKIFSLFILALAVVLLPKNVNAKIGDFGLACSNPKFASTDVRDYTYITCSLYVTATTETLNATLDFNAIHDANLPLGINDVIPAVDAELIKEEYFASEYDLKFSIKNGLIGRINVATLTFENSYNDLKNFETIEWTMDFNNNGKNVQEKNKVEFNKWLSLYSDAGKTKDIYVENDIERFNVLEEYIYSTYIFDNAIYYNSNNTAHALLAFRGTIDVSTLPEGLEIDTMSLSDNEVTNEIELNKDNGQFIIEFDNSEAALKYQSANPVKVTICYKKTADINLPEGFVIDVKDLKYVVNSEKNVEQSLENEKLSASFKQAVNGDWNADDEFNLVDLVAYRMYLAGNDMSDYYDGGLTDNLKNIVDLNKDGELSILDLISARKVLVGLPIE